MCTAQYSHFSELCTSHSGSLGVYTISGNSQLMSACTQPLESSEKVALGAQVLQKAVYSFVLCCTNVAGRSNMLLAIKVAQMLLTDVRR